MCLTTPDLQQQPSASLRALQLSFRVFINAAGAYLTHSSPNTYEVDLRLVSAMNSERDVDEVLQQREARRIAVNRMVARLVSRNLVRARTQDELTRFEFIMGSLPARIQREARNNLFVQRVIAEIRSIPRTEGR